MPAKKKNKQSTPGDSSWRNIQQAGGTRRPGSEIARRRRRLINYRWLLAATAFCLMVLIAGLGWHLWRTAEDSGLGGQGVPLRKVFFETDGVLDDPWLAQRLGLPPGISLMAVDIFALQAALLAEGQTRSVEVERVFPDALRIGIREHQPVLRLAARDRSGERRIYLVSDEGEVYTGHNYPAATLRSLPYLDGLVLRRADETRYQRLPQVPVLAQLIAEARERHPALFNQWTVVDSRDLGNDAAAPGALIRVRTRDYGEWIFAPRDFSRQLQRLELILSHARRQDLSDIQSIDLSFEEPVLATAASLTPPRQAARGIRR